MSRRILVADDSSTIQKVIKIAFARFPVEMVEAASYVEALAALGQAPADCLILDASLPGARGPEDFAKLAQDGSSATGQVPVLLLVGTYETVDEAALNRAGFKHFLKKPFESSDIVTTVDEMLGGSLAAEAFRAPGESIPPGHTSRPNHTTVIGGMPGGGYVPASFALPAVTGRASEARDYPGSVPPPPGGSVARGAVPPPPAYAPGAHPPSREIHLSLGDDDEAPALPSGRPMPPIPPARGRDGRMSSPSDQPPPFAGDRRTSAMPPPFGIERRSEPREPIMPPPSFELDSYDASGGNIGLGTHDEDTADHNPAAYEPRAARPESEFRLDDDPAYPADSGPGFEPPPLPIEEGRRGRRAYSGGIGRETSVPPTPRGPTEAPAAGDLAALRAMLEELLPAMVREAVEAYCERHFKSLAREIIASELRRLADDKARHLVDD